MVERYRVRSGRPRNPNIDRAVVDACVELLAEVGREGLSREKVARRAGVSVMAVYRRFASVEDLLVTVASTPPAGRLPAPDTGTLRGDLVGFLRGKIDLAARMSSRRGAAELVAAAAGSEAIRWALVFSVEQGRREMLDVLRRGQDRGELSRDADVDLIADLLDGLLYYRLLWRSAPLDHAEIEGAIDAVLRTAR